MNKILLPTKNAPKNRRYNMWRILLYAALDLEQSVSLTPYVLLGRKTPINHTFTTHLPCHVICDYIRLAIMCLFTDYRRLCLKLYEQMTGGTAESQPVSYLIAVTEKRE